MMLINKDTLLTW